MLSWTLAGLNASLVIVNTTLCSLLVCILSLVKLLLPSALLRRKVTTVCNGVMWLWSSINLAILNLTNPVEWDIQGGEELKRDGWYLLICNHLSWTDIVVLCSVFRNRIPMPKFFLKQQLLYVPFLGMACWALDMPFMKRHSRQYLLRHPEKRGEDIETTRKSCEKFRHTPTTVVNYVEGTRFTPEKRRQQRSPYQHLLNPKSAGIAYTLAAMGDQFEQVINVSLAYPDNPHKPFKDLLQGKMHRVVVRIETLPVTEQLTGDYFNDKPYKRQFQLWLAELWQQKDHLLAEIYGFKSAKASASASISASENT